MGMPAGEEAGQLTDDSLIGLPDAIRSLRMQLYEAMREGGREALRFRVDPVELEFEVEVTREAGVEGGVKFWVISAGAKGTVATAATHRIKLTLHPQSPGGDVVIRDELEDRPVHDEVEVPPT
jgi:hypothetical protein